MDSEEARRRARDQTRRYTGYTPMFFRSTVGIHASRVEQIALQLNERMGIRPKFGELSKSRLAAIARVHGDLHLLGAHPHVSPAEEENWTDEQIVQHWRKRDDRIRALVDTYPATEQGLDYEDLLRDATELRTLESQIVHYASLVNQYGEILHELHAGNGAFLKRIKDPKKEYTLLPPLDAVRRLLQRIPGRFQELGAIYWRIERQLRLDQPVDARYYVEHAVPLTTSMLIHPTTCTAYTLWRSYLQLNSRPEEVTRLSTPVES